MRKLLLIDDFVGKPFVYLELALKALVFILRSRVQWMEPAS
ncbi:MAG: hypothetical protein PHV34_15750 [Verrucomicrobiae bacterium]|nr:hypothetical protein [Verrucomicrobiae bacterium]